MRKLRRIVVENTGWNCVLHNLLGDLSLPQPEEDFLEGNFLFFFTEEGWERYGKPAWDLMDKLQRFLGETGARLVEIEENHKHVCGHWKDQWSKVAWSAPEWKHSDEDRGLPDYIWEVWEDRGIENNEEFQKTEELLLKTIADLVVC